MTSDPAPDLSIGPYGQDEAALAALAEDGRPRLRVAPAATSVVVLGRGSRPEVELDLVACAEGSVPLLRRRGGGCAVVLDPGNVVVSLALPAAGFADSGRYFDRISSWLAAGLARLDLGEVTRGGASDLVLAGRKVGGACITRRRGLLHYGATLLVTPVVAAMTRYLRHPPREPAYRRGRAHADFVGALPAPTATWLADRLGDVLDLAALG